MDQGEVWPSKPQPTNTCSLAFTSMGAIASDNGCINWHQVLKQECMENISEATPNGLCYQRDIQKGKLQFPHPYSRYDGTKSSYHVYISEI